MFFSEMVQRMFLAVFGHGTGDILNETCQDEHGADLNGKLHSSIVPLTTRQQSISSELLFSEFPCYCAFKILLSPLVTLSLS